ncbi:MAG TPA: DUF6599 family protein [archaeon]|nr:DUF6599 family protein [archaeon]
MYSKYISSVFSLFLIFSVAIIGCKTSRQDQSPGQGTGSSQEKVSPAASLPSLAGLLPSDNESPGWKRTSDVRTFIPDNLWEYIDGGAEGYLVFNFQEVVTADYENKEAGLQAVVDIYRMADRLCGFGIYAAERSYDAQFINTGSQGYVSGNALHFWQGPYYVKLTAFQEGEEVAGQLEKLSSVVASKIHAEPVFPPELDIFPKDGLVPNSERYLARDMLGQSTLKNGFTAEYKVGDNEFKIFFIMSENPDSLFNSYQLYKGFMDKYGQNVNDHSEDEIPYFQAEDPYYGKMVAMYLGKVIVGILGLENPELVNSYLQQMQEKLVVQGLV